MKRFLLPGLKGMLIIILVMVSTSIVIAASKDDLVNRFADVLKFKADNVENHKKKIETKVTPLFIRSSEHNSIDLTMLIAYNKNITKVARRIIKGNITPLIFSVSAMPFIETNFDPSFFCFEQDGIRWFPKPGDNAFDMFPLGDSSIFGGEINDNELQQGVILLPEIFNINKPIKIIYKNFKKTVCLSK